jgi:hypothetical protein
MSCGAHVKEPSGVCAGDRMIPVDNDSELMDRLYAFLGPALEQEDMFLHRSPVCLTLDVSRLPQAISVMAA